MANPMPAIFFGHGNPLNALQGNAWTEGWAALGRSIPEVSFPVEGFDGGSVSMLTVRIG